MPRTPRRSRHPVTDAMMAEVTRILQDRRDVVLLSDANLTDAATVRRSDVDRAVDFYRTAVAGSDLVTILDGPAGESERD